MTLRTMLSFVCLLPGAAAPAGEVPCGVDVVFDEPSDDRWHYPFNFTPGFRATGSCFGASGELGFNDRDAYVVLGWDTSELIEPGMGLDAYDVVSITVTLTNQPSAEWPVDLTVDEWSTYGGSGLDPDPGRPIELFGAGFGPELSESAWRENSFFVGGDGDFIEPRDPYPFVFQEATGELVHVEDNVKGFFNEGLSEPLCEQKSPCPFTPQPWAIGVPIDYTPGDQPTPFDVEFEIDLDLSDGAVREYFLRQLDAGRILVVVTSLREASFMGPQAGFPTFFMKEGVPLDPLAKAAQLRVRFAAPPDGDYDLDGEVGAADWDVAAECVAGPGLVPSPAAPLSGGDCLCVFDFDADRDVDLTDVAALLRRLGPVR